MARMNISVPDGLKRRMDKVKEPVNWSAVAAQAYEQKLGEIAKMKKVKQMSDVIQRLRASKIEGDSALTEQGQEDGRAWASHVASAAELEQLDRWRDGFGTDWNYALASGVESAYGPGEQIYFGLHPEDNGDRQLAQEFWETALGSENITRPDEETWCYGFVEGALEVWVKVEAEL